MGMYLCDRCGKGRHADEHGFHIVRREGTARDRCLCDECFPAELDEHESGDAPLATIDGKPVTQGGDRRDDRPWHG